MRDTFKRAAHIAATLAIVPMLVSFTVRSWLVGRDRAFEGSMQALALVPGLWGGYLRRAFLAQTIAACARSATIEFGCLFSHTGARLDEHVYIGPHASLGFVHVERDALIGPRVQILSGAHTHASTDPERPIREQPLQKTLVRIGRGAWIGAGAIVMADVGANAIVGAGSVVTRAIPEGVVAAGVPARMLRTREADAAGQDAPASPSR